MKILVCFLFILFAYPAMAKPERIVSVNLCTDQLVLEMAAPEHIAAVSFNSHNASMSLHYEAARHYPAIRAELEEILSHKPDLVILGAGTPHIERALRAHGITVKTLPMAMTLQDIRTQVITLGEWLGEEKKAAALVVEMEKKTFSSPLAGEHAQQGLCPQLSGGGVRECIPRIGVYYLNGYTDGKGTLMDEIITAAGGKNIAAERGINGMGYLPMEVLVDTPPDLLITNQYENAYPALGEKVLRHPAIARAMRGNVLKLDGRRLSCATPESFEVIRDIATAAGNK